MTLGNKEEKSKVKRKIKVLRFKPLKHLNIFPKPPSGFTGKVINEGFSVERYKNGKLHSINKPTVVAVKSGTKLWYKNGVLHRKDAPAIEYADGRKEWYLNGVKVRSFDPSQKTENDFISDYDKVTMEIEAERRRSREGYDLRSRPIFGSNKHQNSSKHEDQDPTLVRHGVSSSLYG